MGKFYFAFTWDKIVNLHVCICKNKICIWSDPRVNLPICKYTPCVFAFACAIYLPRVKFAHRSIFTRVYFWRMRIGLKFRTELFNIGNNRLITPGRHVREINTPLIPQFYIDKLGYAGVYLFFFFLLQNLDCGYSLEPPRRGCSNVYPQSMF